MKKTTFSTSFLFFWVKGEIEVDSRFIKTNISNTILNIIPSGRDKQSIPLKNVSGSTISTSFKIKPFIIGLIIALGGLASIRDSFFAALVLLILGMALALSGIQTVLTIEKSGSNMQISVPFFNKTDLIEISQTIDHALSEDIDKTDLNMFFDKKEN